MPYALEVYSDDEDMEYYKDTPLSSGKKCEEESREELNAIE